MKTILFIQGIYDTIDLFIAALSRSFRQMGFVCHVLDTREKAEFMPKLKRILMDEHVDALVTFNNIGYNLSFSEGKNIWEEKGIPYINILMDHPFHYANPLRNAPETSVVFCTDRNHVEFLKRFYPNLKKVDFMPHAGMEADLSEHASPGSCYLCTEEKGYHPPVEERSIDVLYAGGLSKYVAEGLVPDLGEIKEFDAFALTQEVLSDLISHPNKTTESAIESYFSFIGKEYTDEELNHWITELRFIDSYATSFYREQSVRLLVEAGIQVAVFGGGWDQCEWADNPNFLYGGKVLAPQVLELMNHSKIVLNTMTWYKNGIHDRIINGMLAKAAVVTDVSDYLEEELKKTEKPFLEPFYLTRMAELPDKVRKLLENETDAEELARRGYAYARKNHTWMARAEYLLNTCLKE